MTVTVFTDAELFVAVNDGESTLSSNINDTQSTIGLASSANFATDGGYAWIVSTNGTTPGEECVKYTGKSGNNLTGVTRAQGGTSALNADSGDAVELRVNAEMHNAVKDAAKTTSQQLRNLATGVISFTDISLSNTDGSVTNGFMITTDGDGDIICNTDTGNLASDFYLSGGTGSLEVDIWRWTMDGSDMATATDVWNLYTGGGLDGTGSLWAAFEPSVTDGASAVAFEFDSQDDLATSTASIFRVSNSGSAVFNVRKAQTEAPKFKATGVEVGLNMPIVAADPSSPANGDVWFKNTGSARSINARMAGVTYSVTLT